MTWKMWEKAGKKSPCLYQTIITMMSHPVPEQEHTRYNSIGPCHRAQRLHLPRPSARAQLYSCILGVRFERLKQPNGHPGTCPRTPASLCCVRASPPPCAVRLGKVVLPEDSSYLQNGFGTLNERIPKYRHRLVPSQRG